MLTFISTIQTSERYCWYRRICILSHCHHAAEHSLGIKNSFCARLCQCAWNEIKKLLPVPFLLLLFPFSIKSVEDVMPEGICPFYLGREMFLLFAFLNCLAAQACFMCAAWNVSSDHVSTVLWLMLDFLQQIWIMLKQVLNWREYVNNSQMGIFVQGNTSSLWQELVFGRSIIPSLKATLLLPTLLAWQLLA